MSQQDAVSVDIVGVYSAPTRVISDTSASAEVALSSSEQGREPTPMARQARRDYFRGPENVARVRAWRTDHPGYWRRSSPHIASAEHSLTQPTGMMNQSP